MTVPRLLLESTDLEPEEVRLVLDRARAITGHDPLAAGGDPFVLGSLFLEPSLRTRLGFQVAAARLGGQSVEVEALRQGAEMSASEDPFDTLRVLSGMVDVVVMRLGRTVDRRRLAESMRSPLINGGDRCNHPTQALVDLFAIATARGEIGSAHLTICGDLGLRTVRSLLQQLERIPPASLTLVAPPGRDVADALGPQVAAVTRQAAEFDPSGIDVLYMAGLPERSSTLVMGEAQRARYSLSRATLDRMPPDAVVICPLPIIDEIDVEARHDQRVRAFEQSDDAVAVRMAVLELLLDRVASGVR